MDSSWDKNHLFAAASSRSSVAAAADAAGDDDRPQASSSSSSGSSSKPNNPAANVGVSAPLSLTILDSQLHPMLREEDGLLSVPHPLPLSTQQRQSKLVAHRNACEAAAMSAAVGDPSDGSRAARAPINRRRKTVLSTSLRRAGGAGSGGSACFARGYYHHHHDRHHDGEMDGMDVCAASGGVGDGDGEGGVCENGRLRRLERVAALRDGGEKGGGGEKLHRVPPRGLAAILRKDDRHDTLWPWLRVGRDPQGIPWESLTSQTRSDYRRQRLQQYQQQHGLLHTTATHGNPDDDDDDPDYHDSPSQTDSDEGPSESGWGDGGDNDEDTPMTPSEHGGGGEGHHTPQHHQQQQQQHGQHGGGGGGLTHGAGAGGGFGALYGGPQNEGTQEENARRLRAISLCRPVRSNQHYAELARCYAAVQPAIMHFQLRHLLSCGSSRHEVYYVGNRDRTTLTSYNLLSGLKGVIHSSPDGNPFTCCDVRHGLAVTGSMNSRLMVSSLRGANGHPVHQLLTSRRTSDTLDDITNYVSVILSLTGMPRVLACNNDASIKEFDPETARVVNSYHLEWAVNQASVSVDGKMVCVVGDDKAVVMLERETGDRIATLHGHCDHGFASDFHCDGRLCATGNQDNTCRVWDLRHLRRSVKVLGSQMGPVRSIQFSPDGSLLSCAEPMDLVQLYDVRSGFTHHQQLDFFGSIAGLCFSHDSSTLFTAVQDSSFGGLLEYRLLT
ncbi:unnamed protein product [Vitrella brassicaformis CCMP3155]|uniref:Uncharacterized protein n=2 Tax=Vitrella brassicaformis TaxID=1169539 RepID=A0A0G4G2G0_VITBC|nr:unnamed protein product [Vitrella brassicaformis CCMP3155]|mmetsp:Transcript_22815/g.65274  ORF Transcript_22815/g.65274 Transcript_22815/m.65274 type:complete len:726 (-) Transcript_22815:1539-3716(-)|eukprot:CEM22033.1 unnamed protein product [Vitrella brassicaformis CCMP3155]